MTKFQVGDRVTMPGTPIVLEVLELGICDDVDPASGQPCRKEIFRFADPETGEADWIHSVEFVKIDR